MISIPQISTSSCMEIISWSTCQCHRQHLMLIGVKLLIWLLHLIALTHSQIMKRNNSCWKVGPLCHCKIHSKGSILIPLCWSETQALLLLKRLTCMLFSVKGILMLMASYFLNLEELSSHVCFKWVVIRSRSISQFLGTIQLNAKPMQDTMLENWSFMTTLISTIRVWRSIQELQSQLPLMLPGITLSMICPLKYHKFSLFISWTSSDTHYHTLISQIN